MRWRNRWCRFSRRPVRGRHEVIRMVNHLRSRRTNFAETFGVDDSGARVSVSRGRFLAYAAAVYGRRIRMQPLAALFHGACIRGNGGYRYNRHCGHRRLLQR